MTTRDDEHLRHGFLYLGGSTNQLGLDLSPTEIHDALAALYDAGYVEGQVSYESGLPPTAHFNHSSRMKSRASSPALP